MNPLDRALWMACDWLASRTTPTALFLSLAAAVIVVGLLETPI